MLPAIHSVSQSIDIHNSIDRAQSGSVDAFGEIVQYFQNRLVRFLMLRGAQQADAEDIAQQTFVNAWQHIASYDTKWQFSTWLYTIAGRIASQASNHLNSNNPIEHDTLAMVDNTIDSLLKNTVWSAARQHLDSKAFQALWLHYGEGFSGKEIGKIMRRNPIWVRVSLHRSKQLLQEKLASTTVDPEIITIQANK